MPELFERVPAIPDAPSPGWSRAAASSVLGALVLGLLVAVSFLTGTGDLQMWCLGLYVVAVAWWIVEQVRESRLGYATVPAAWVRRVVLVVGVVALAVGGLLAWQAWSWSLGSLLIAAGVLLLYWSAGYAIHAARARIRFVDPGAGLPVPVLVSVLAGLLALAFTGLALLGEANVVVAGVMVALGIGFVPAVASLLAEHATLYVRAKQLGATTVLLIVFGAGFVALGLVAAVTLPKTGAVVGLVALLGVGVLVAFIASGTLADVTVVLGLVALMCTTPTQGADVADAARGSDGVLVALGDSYMSGEGAKSFVPGTDDGGSDECRRAATAWAPMLAEDRPDLFSGGIWFRACSGAKTFNVRLATTDPDTGKELEPRTEGQWGDLTQLEEYQRDMKGTDPALVVLSIGGNDAGFSTLGLVCLAPGDCDDPVPSGLLSGPNIKRVQNRLRQTYLDVRQVFPSSPVVVIPYPKPVDTANVPCAEAPLSGGDVHFVNGILGELDDAIAEVADEFGFYYAKDVEDALVPQKVRSGWTTTDLRLCAPVRIAKHQRAGINFVTPRSVGGTSGVRLNPLAWKHGSLHPNESGHRAMLAAFEWWLSQQKGAGGATGLPALEAATVRTTDAELPPQPGGEKYVTRTLDSDCAKLGGPNSCNDQAKAWALDQTGTFLLANALVLLLVAGCAWLIAVVVAAAGRR